MQKKSFILEKNSFQKGLDVQEIKQKFTKVVSFVKTDGTFTRCRAQGTIYDRTADWCKKV